MNTGLSHQVIVEDHPFEQKEQPRDHCAHPTACKVAIVSAEAKRTSPGMQSIPRCVFELLVWLLYFLAA